jgi:hypothetical protein
VLSRLIAKKEINMAPKKHTVQFNAHKTVKLPTEVEFETKKGKKVDFVAAKPAKVPVHVKFKAKDK